DGAPAGPQRISSRRIELPVALGAVRLAIDVGQVVPDAQQMRISLRLECRADLPAPVSRRPVQGGGYRPIGVPDGEVLFPYGDAAEKHFLRAPKLYAPL